MSSASMEIAEVELLCIKYPCTQAHHRATVLTASRILLTLCMALNHYALGQRQHSLGPCTIAEGRLH